MLHCFRMVPLGGGDCLGGLSLKKWWPPVGLHASDSGLSNQGFVIKFLDKWLESVRDKVLMELVVGL
jgi:hypothetical protein